MAIHGKESHMDQTTTNAPDERISPEQIRQTWLDGGRRRGYTAGQLGGAGRNILRNPRSYINFIIAIFIIQTLLCLLMTVAELDNRTAYREITEHYDYHMQLRSISQPQYAELHNLDAEIPLDWRPYLPYKSITYERLADGRYHAYITLRGNDLALERQQICDGFLESVGAAGESLVISYTPLYNYLTYYAVNIRVETGWAVFLFSALSLFMLTTLYNARLNHERFQNGIYMACGAGFRQLFTTAVGEMLFIVLLTALPAVIVANVTAAMLYAGTGTEYSLRLLPLLLTWLLGVLIAFFAVWMPMRHLSRRPPVALLAAQDNSNLVTSPRRSLHIFGRRFPSHYEAFSLWRYRRYLAGLLCASVLFAALWLGLIRVADFRTVLATASAPEFTVEFHPTAPDATTLNENVEWLSSDLEAIDGVDHCEYKVSTSLMAKRTFLAVTAKAARHAGAYTVHFEDQSGVYGAATNYAEYVALNEDSLRRLTERTPSMEGDPARLLNEENTVILSTSLHNAERFDFAPGDTVLLAVNTQSTMTTVPYLTMNNLDLLRIILSDEEFILEEYTVAAVVHDEAAGDRIMIGVDHGTYEDLTGMEAYTTALDVYLADEMDFGTLRTVTDRVQLAANGYFSSSHYRDGSYNSAILRTANLVIRIPADKLSAFCKAVEGVGHVTHFQETIDDITLSYVAIESRIEVLESEETALMTMLAKAESISDMLAIRKQLEGVQGELASLRAQKRVYDDQVAYSTVNMTVHEVKRVSEDTERMTFGQEIGHTFSESLYALGAFFRGLSVFFIGNSPVLLLLAALVACGVILVRRILRKRKMAAQKENDNKE